MHRIVSRIKAAYPLVPLKGIKGVYPFAIMLALWQLVTAVQLFPAYFFPPPKDVFLVLWRMLLEGTLFQYTAVTFGAGVLGFTVGTGAGFLLAAMSAVKPWARDFFSPLASAAYPIPAIIWVPIALLWFGFSIGSLVFVVALASFFLVFYNTFMGIKSIPPIYVRAAQNLNLTGLVYFREVIVFGALPFVIAGLRLAVGAAWRVIVGAEMLATTVQGLGWFLWRAGAFFRYDQVFAGMIIIGTIGLIMETFLLGRLEKKTIGKWY